MKKLHILFILFAFLLHSAIALASGYLIFQNDNLLDLSLVGADGNNATYVLQNKTGTKIAGSIGDLIGFQEAEVVIVDDSYITVETVEIVTGQNGNEYEQPSRMRIPLAGGSYGKGMQ